MRLLTLNTHSWREEHAMEKLGCLAETIIERNYDVIALQEVNQMTDSPLMEGSQLRKNNFMYQLIEEIKKRKGPHYYGYWEKAKYLRGYYEEGLCLMSKTPFIEQEVFTISKIKEDTSAKKRKIVKAGICYKGQQIDFFSCHLGWWQDELDPFRMQCELLLSKVSSQHLTFMLGDFNNNANIRGEGYDYLMEKGWFDTYELAQEKDEGATVQGEISGWKGNEEALRIDLILANRKVPVKMSRVLFNGIYKPMISDHFGVETDITL